MLHTWLSGLGIGAGLIIAIGAQNAFVLRQGIRREYVAIAVAICMLGDIVLVSAGAAGLGLVVDKVPALITIMRWAGAAYLLWFGINSFRSALRPQALLQAPEGAGVIGQSRKPGATKRGVAAGAAAITFLNPHVYLDTVIFLGSIAQQHDSAALFAFGAITASTLWFSALGFAAHLMAKPLAKPRIWRSIDILVGIMMVVIAVLLVAG